MNFESETNFTNEQPSQVETPPNIENYEIGQEESSEIDIREILKDGFEDSDAGDVVELRSKEDIEKFQKAYGVDLETILEQKINR